MQLDLSLIHEYRIHYSIYSCFEIFIHLSCIASLSPSITYLTQTLTHTLKYIFTILIYSISLLNRFFFWFIDLIQNNIVYLETQNLNNAVILQLVFADRHLGYFIPLEPASHSMIRKLYVLLPNYILLGNL